MMRAKVMTLWFFDDRRNFNSPFWRENVWAEILFIAYSLTKF